MDEKSDQILNHIETQRDALGRNLDELEHKVKRTADWRTHFDENPALVLGLALGGGMIVGATVGGGRRKRRYRYRGGSSSSSSWSGVPSATSTSTLSNASSLSSASFGDDDIDSNSATSHQRKRAVEALDHIKAALIAFGIAKAKEFLSQSLPGFDEHLNEAGGAQNASGTSGSQGTSGTQNRTQNSGYGAFSGEGETVGVGSETTYGRTSTDLGV